LSNNQLSLNIKYDLNPCDAPQQGIVGAILIRADDPAEGTGCSRPAECPCAANATAAMNKTNECAFTQASALANTPLILAVSVATADSTLVASAFAE
jgi:hypothetical protein